MASPTHKANNRRRTGALTRFGSPRRWLLRVLFWGGAVAVGAAAVLFALASEAAHAQFRAARALAPWLPLVGMPLGLASVVFLSRRFFPGAQGSGIPQTVAALEQQDRADREHLLSLRIAAGKVCLTVGAILSGASVGREGPTVQVGAAIMHTLGGISRFPQLAMDRALILAGGAAGVAAAFNTPLAGIVFAIEELSRSYEQRTNGTILTAVILAGVTSLAMLGNYVYFGTTTATVGSDPQNWLAVAVIGVTGGLAGGLFSRLLIATSRGLPGGLGRFARARPVRFAAACGLLLAALGMVSGDTTYGTGYEETRRILVSGGDIPASFGLCKFLATLVSYLSGVPGGIFAPSLAVGAGIGVNLSALLPHVPLTAVVVLSMAAYFAGVVQAPLTAFVIVSEMTDNHDIVLLLMGVSLIANGASRLICPQPLYKALAEGFMRAR
ncbi:MAG: chloride channel protein [Gammaproteobacteria bacterium]